MAARQKNNDDFESRFFDAITDDIKDLKDNDREIGKNYTIIDGRVKRVEDKVFSNVPNDPAKLSPWYKDSAIIRLLTYILVVIMLAIGAWKGIDIGKYL